MGPTNRRNLYNFKHMQHDLLDVWLWTYWCSQMVLFSEIFETFLINYRFYFAPVVTVLDSYSVTREFEYQ